MKAVQTSARVILLMILAVTPTQAKQFPSLKTSCPSHWPGTPGNPLVKSFLYSETGVPLPIKERKKGAYSYCDFPEKAYDIGCSYKSGEQLIIPVPGTHPRCTAVFSIASLEADEFDQLQARCTSEPTGNPDIDRIHLIIPEPISRDTLFFGVTLGMTAVQVEAAWSQLGYRSIEPGKQAEMPEKRKLFVDYANDGTVQRVTVRPDHPGDESLYWEIKSRFALYEDVCGPTPAEQKNAGWHCVYWPGKDNTRVEIDLLSHQDMSTNEVRLLNTKLR